MFGDYSKLNLINLLNPIKKKINFITLENVKTVTVVSYFHQDLTVSGIHD